MRESCREVRLYSIGAPASLSALCRVFKGSRSGYYRRSDQLPRQRVPAGEKLLGHIQRVHAVHREHAGALRTRHVLKRLGVTSGKRQVARRSRVNGTVAKRRKRFIAATRSKYTKWIAPNLLRRQFTVQRPNQGVGG